MVGAEGRRRRWQSWPRRTKWSIFEKVSCLFSSVGGGLGLHCARERENKCKKKKRKKNELERMEAGGEEGGKRKRWRKK